MTQRLSVRMFTAILFTSVTALTSCHHDMDDPKKPYDVPDEERVRYAEKMLGTTIDPNQDWELTSEYSVSVTADAALEGIDKVMILDGNPYAGKTYVLAVKAATRDTKTTLSFRGPSGAEYLYAACMNSDGKCVARPFTPGEETEVSFAEELIPGSLSAEAGTRGSEEELMDSETEIIKNPTYKNFKFKDFINTRNALFRYLPEGENNVSKFNDDIGSLARVKENDFNFYEIPMVFFGGIGKADFESDRDNLFYYWYPLDKTTKEKQAYILKDHFKNAFQPKYDGSTKSYILEGMYLLGKDVDGKNTTQFAAGDVLDFNMAIDEEIIDIHDLRVRLFTMNNYLFAACEDGDDWDFNDRLFWFPYGLVNLQDYTDPFDPTPSETQTWTYAWEDQNFGDYDLNDCVIEVQENAEDKSKLDITLVALGATRELWLGFENKYAKTYADYQHVFEQELHQVMGIPVGQMANTGNGTQTVNPVKITLPKPDGFDFQKCSFILGARVEQDERGIYDSDYYAISIAKKGQDPHGIVIPGRWQWPTERTCIVDAYKQFATWAHDITDPTVKNWYMFPESSKVINR